MTTTTNPTPACETCHAEADISDAAGHHYCRLHQHKAEGTKTLLYELATAPDLTGYLAR